MFGDRGNRWHRLLLAWIGSAIVGAWSVALAMPPERVVSLAPNLTQTVLALGEGRKLVAVSDYCVLPPGRKDLPRVGGLVNPNLEAIAALRPDRVLLLTAHEEFLSKFSALGLPTEVFHYRSLNEIRESIREVGQVLGVARRADELVAAIEKKIAAVRSRVSQLPTRRVLVAVDVPPGAGQNRSVNIAGNGTLIEEMIRIAGGVNAYEGG
ncbi:MAG: ABC transporter substrate-binding protein, partial [Bdellovibrionales bacterium]|nr:ABC transporter substrate-binding protein [Bdellovibrionales bacterium]